MAEFIRVEGVQYSCHVRYASPHALDRLANFVLRTAMMEHRVRRIPDLVNGFGLPPRVMQDVLADLLRRGYATLDLTRHELRPVPDAVGRTGFRDDRTRLVWVWQDPITGRFLPSDRVERLSTPPPGTTVVTIRPRPAEDLGHTPPDFIDAPSTRIIASLNLVDPSFLASRVDREEDVDSVIDRDRVGPLDVYLPIERTEFASYGERPVEFVVAWGLPGWLSRAWSLALARTPGRGNVDADADGPRVVELARSHARAVRDRAADGGSADSSSVFEESRFLTHHARWLAAFRAACTTPPSGDRDGDGDEADDDPALLDEQEARLALAGRLRTAAATGVRFAPPDGHATHLNRLWDHVRSYLLVNARSWDAGEVRGLVDGAPVSPDPRPPYLILPDLAPAALPAGLDRAEVLYPGVFGTITPDFALRDGDEFVVGGPALLRSDRPALSLTGWSPAAELTEIVRAEEGGWLTTDLLRRGRAGDEPRPAASEPDATPPDPALDAIHGVLEALDALARDLAEARADALALAAEAEARSREASTLTRDARIRKGESEPAPASDPGTGPDAAPPETDPAAADDRATPERARPDLNLLARAEALRAAVAGLDAPPDDLPAGGPWHPPVIPLHGRSFLDLTIEAFDRSAIGPGPARRIELHMTGDDARFWEQPAAFDLLRRALQAGAAVLLVACPSRPGDGPSEETEAALRHLRRLLRAEGLDLAVARCGAALPPGLIFQEGGADGTHHVGVGTLAPGGDADADGAVGFAVQSRPVATAIRRARDHDLVHLADEPAP